MHFSSSRHHVETKICPTRLQKQENRYIFGVVNPLCSQDVCCTTIDIQSAYRHLNIGSFKRSFDVLSLLNEIEDSFREIK